MARPEELIVEDDKFLKGKYPPGDSSLLRHEGTSNHKHFTSSFESPEGIDMTQQN